MRRKDRELTKEETLELLDRAEYGVLSMINKNNEPYGIPMNFALSNDSIFFHCSCEGGEKINCIKYHPDVCFTVVEDTKVLPEIFSTLYMSAIAYGKIEIIKSEQEKRKGIEAILRKYSPDYIEEGLNFIENNINKIDILKLKIEKVTGKGKKL